MDPAREQQIVAELAQLADEFCACSDAACVYLLDAKVADVLKRHGGRGASEAVERAASDFQARAAGCVQALKAAGRFVNPKVALAEKLADEVCACPDRDCRKAAIHRAHGEGEKLAPVKGSSEDEKRILAASQRMAACMSR